MQEERFLTELEEIIQQNREEAFDRVVYEKASYPYLYHLSSIRQNIVDWLDITKEMRVLECNAQCGALTGRLLEKAGKVTAVTDAGQKADIIRKRTKGKGNLEICQEQDFFSGTHGPYDRILIVGYFSRYRDRLHQLRDWLAPGGRLIVADSNRIGLKYMAGCQEEYQGGYFTGVEGYAESEPKDRSYTKKEYGQFLKEAGFAHLEFYFPYPDHLFPGSIYSEDHLPAKGELSDNRRNFDRDRYQLFDERKVFDTFLAEGIFPEFSNSFLIEAAEQEAPVKTIYTRYSNERAARFQIRTEICKSKAGKLVYKYALKPEGAAHLHHIKEAYEGLSACYQNPKIMFCTCRQEGERVCFPFVQGVTLQDVMEQAVKEQDTAFAEAIIKDYIGRIKEDGGSRPFQMTDEFQEIFGEADFPEETECSVFCDIDMIFSNILLTNLTDSVLAEESGGMAERPEGYLWNVIDYEWAFSFPIPKAFILYRAIYFAYYQILNDTDFELAALYEMAGITEEMRRKFQEMEEHFQEYLGKNSMPVRNMQRLMGTRLIPFKRLRDCWESGGVEQVGLPAESGTVRVRTLKYHIDREEYQDGSVVCCGWAFARTWDGRTLPVSITVESGDGCRIAAEITRTKRQDVAEAMKIRHAAEPAWGFNCVWPAERNEKWRLSFSRGKKKEIYESGSRFKG